MGGIKARLVGHHAINHGEVEQSYHTKKEKLGEAGFAGAIVYTEPLIDISPEVRPFFNPNIGVAMNKDVSFGGIPEIINNGGTSTEWTLSGSGTFSESGGNLVLAGGNNDDVAIFSEETPTTVDLSNYTALTMKVNLNTYSPATNDFTVQFDLAGVDVGDPVELNQFLDTSDFSEQSIAIGLGFFNLLSTLVDGFTITVDRTGGSKPTVDFDDIQLEQTGSPLVFKMQPERGEIYNVNEINISFANNIPSTIVDGTMGGLSYDDFFGVPALSNGFVYSATQRGEIIFAVALRTIGDFLSAGANISNSISDGTNTFITIRVPFVRPIRLDGTMGDFLSFTVNDDLSSLLQLSAITNGGKVQNELGN